MSPSIYLTIVVVYVLAMLAIGYWCMRRTKSVGDFFLGGRTLGPWMSAFAYGTTYFSAVLFIGYAGKLGWGFGIHTMWIVVGNTLIGTLLAWKLLAGRTRDMTTRLNAITMPEFLRARYGSKALQVISALVVFVFLVPYSASVLMGLSYLFEMTLHISYEHALYFLTALTAQIQTGVLDSRTVLGCQTSIPSRPASAYPFTGSKLRARPGCASTATPPAS